VPRHAQRDVAQRTHAARGPRRRPLLAAAVAIAALLAVGAPAAAAAPTSLDVLSWADEFDGSSLDTTRWAERASGPRHDGVLTPDAVSVGAGVLTITTYTEGGTHYSGMISTHRRGADGFEQAYGYFEARIKFHSAPGQWSSFWLQSPTIGNLIGDPASAGVEMDVVEHRARCVNAPAPTPPGACSPTNDISGRTRQALTWDGYGQQSRSTAKLSDPLPGLGNDSWHTWALRWTPTELTFYYDDAVTWTITRPISRHAQYLILSSEVGRFFAGEIPAGGYGTRATSTTNMQVDYVRAYTPATAPANTTAPATAGIPEVGETLSCSSGAWSANPPPSLTYEWLRDDAPIPGAFSAAYVLQLADAGRELGCRVNASNAAGNASSPSSALLIRNRPLAALAPATRQLAAPLGPSAVLGASAAAAPASRVRDGSAARVRLSTRRSQRLRSSINITIACPRENCRATTRATVRPLWPSTGPTYRPRAISTTIAKAIPVTVRVALSRRARVTIRRALRARKRMVMQLHVRVADDAGNTRTLTRQIALKL
jgi:beta-glucanase (GH16 family)